MEALAEMLETAENLNIGKSETKAITNDELQEMLIEAEKNEANYRAEQSRKKLEESGLGKRFWTRTFEALSVDETNKKAVVTCKRFVEAFPTTTGILLNGNIGTGKTHLAAAITNDLVKKGYKIGFGNITDIMERIKNSYSRKAEITETEIIDELVSYDLLVIDDLGKEVSTANNTKILYNLINRLYEAEKPLIATTNYKGRELIEKYGESGEAIISRIYEMTYPIELNGKNRRVTDGKVQIL